MSDDPELQKELNELLQEQEKRLGERGARDQAVAANTILALMGDLDFTKLPPDVRGRRIYDVFTYASYAIAGMPAVQNAMAFAYGGLNEEARVKGIVRALGLFATEIPVGIGSSAAWAIASAPHAADHAEYLEILALRHRQARTHAEVEEEV